MFDLGVFELLLVGIVALIVVGPKDLPVMFRTLGQYTGRAKAMAREFTNAMNAAADEAGVKEIASDINKIGGVARNPAKAGMGALKEAADDLVEFDPDKVAARKETKTTTDKPDE